MNVGSRPCKVDPTNNGSYLRLLDRGAEFTLCIAAAKLRTATLIATFAKAEPGTNPYSWLSGRTASISIVSAAVNDGSQTRADYDVEAGLPIEVHDCGFGRIKPQDIANATIPRMTDAVMPTITATAPDSFWRKPDQSTRITVQQSVHVCHKSIIYLFEVSAAQFASICAEPEFHIRRTVEVDDLHREIGIDP